MEIVLLAALADHGVIGVDGALPWHLPDDLRRFKRLTLGKPVVMGRKTFASIGRPLPKRRNVVLSRSATPIEGVELVHGVEQALTLLADEPEICVIGGGEVYRAFLPLATRLELTHVEASVPGDTRFPDLDPSLWRCVAEERHAPDDAHRWPMRFATYVRAEPR
ncbi:MAG: type 3 dihydrofolate reductase [Sandaracinaceae bacterium]|nr:type 3 dihydrofolate reductase [Sandaracinaceae bacterium]